ncbi:UDP-N-acetylmuramoyl-L-alanine--D-glutamate ligase [Hydrogenobacter sp. T-2]|uniref:UDP-N-acetylmuramoyl-L-alanine--D-glutamate ligase n=1 Tax=Pampinifervens diazotrophicum TaxID=1632018 RepID=UPI002B25D713|nr:UDP-N-acetylmuramoyl-L-alanine--D-glutamate ligase [Hydrogenobacter sp. T-2]WPM31879.1 UDP-N-acetylmuramoyl-L-alanine--D-glutamate ligase [Hydrogenobacter sp. T-2]
MKRVLLWGLGVSGRSALNLLKAKGFEVYAGDDARGDNFKEFLHIVDTVVLSPGIPPHHALWKEAQEKGIEVIGELELAWRFFEGKALAITGTDGKSTTTRLTYLMLKEVYANVEEGANAGKPLSEIVLSNPSCLAVLEVSSFQGKTLKTFRPIGGAFLNFSEDHLDWHPSLQDYLESKRNIFSRQREEDFLLLNAKDPRIRETPSDAKKFFLLEEGMQGYIKEGKAYFLGEELFEVERLKIRGKHNWHNALFAGAMARLMGVEREIIQEVLYSFSGLPYRMEYMGSFGGVEVYNDSKSTTVNALRSALESFEDGKVILIAGGKDKGGDFEGIKELVKKKTRLSILIGEAREKIAKAWRGCEVYLAKDLESAVSKAFEFAKQGDIILFSPACASFDMFRDYKERGERFKELVFELGGKSL